VGHPCQREGGHPLPNQRLEIDFHHIGSPAADRHLDLGQQPTNQRVSVAWKVAQRTGLPTGTYTATMTATDAQNRRPVIVPIAWIKLRRASA
jgi:hypothetical protein